MPAPDVDNDAVLPQAMTQLSNFGMLLCLQVRGASSSLHGAPAAQRESRQIDVGPLSMVSSTNYPTPHAILPVLEPVHCAVKPVVQSHDSLGCNQ